METVFKIVRAVEGQYLSLGVSTAPAWNSLFWPGVELEPKQTNSYLVIYKINLLVEPTVPKAWLFAFENFADALAYAATRYAGRSDKLSIFFAKTEWTKRISHECSGTDGISLTKFWKGMEIGKRPVVPGTVICPNIELKELMWFDGDSAIRAKPEGITF